jgi:DNA-3-methyladenine glycosylase II
VSAPPRALSYAALHAGARALAAVDQRLGHVVDRLGLPPMFARRPGFASLVRIILEQQVSLAAAWTMYRRLGAHAGGITPESIAGLGITGLRELGLTRQKSAYCHGLAMRVVDGRLDLATVSRADEVEARARLLEVPGIGPWSVDIYFLMALRRPDVWPQGDLALAVALKEVRALRSVPNREQQQRIAQSWAPWRSVAARILWMHYLSRQKGTRA